MDEFDKTLNQQIIDMLCNPDHLNLFLRSKTFEEDGECDQIEEWYGTKYSI